MLPARLASLLKRTYKPWGFCERAHSGAAQSYFAARHGFHGSNTPTVRALALPRVNPSPLLPMLSKLGANGSEFPRPDLRVVFAFLPLFLVAHCESSDEEQRRLCTLAKNAQPSFVQRLKQLLAQGVDANSRHPGGWTALQAAVANNNVAACQALLAHGASPNEVDQYEASSLGAIYSRQTDFSEHVRPQVASEGMAALHYAALFGFRDIASLLLQHGADPTQKTKSGHTPADCAVEGPLQEMLIAAAKQFVDTKEEEARRKRTENPLHLRLKQHIIGQEAPIDAVSAAVCRRQNGWHDENHPMVFLFLGSSGIGKTELAKRLAEFLHNGDSEGFIRFDMSEYQEKHEVAKFIGSPPGYIGHDEGGQLVNRLKSFPKAVVLLDEVEKAHPDVLTVLLQLFDEGRLTDGKGSTIDCKDAIFVMTSNLAQDQIAEFATDYREEHGPNASIYPTKQFREQTIRPILKNHFGRNEFLGRIQEVLFFWPFNQEQLRLLVVKELHKWAQRAKERHNIDLTWDEEVVSVIASQYNLHFGARSLQHAVNRIIINKLAAAHEEDRLKRNDKVHVMPLNKHTDAAEGADVVLQITSANAPAKSSWLSW